MPQRTGEVRKFRWAVSVGLCVCSILIVLWTLFVMLAVPQTGPAPSLEEAADKGCISTVRASPCRLIVPHRLTCLVRLAL